eukprot:TRINITY_DN10144_c0_g2_i1.p1 TRINITY_DN10144_c0_g2~~TRINITY_DN10144_c0_g2_i1.p1  ORF type:complete len:455 (+),score=108.70 TRINITY_DN10144_c0_g2_i1:300-1664(+)
MTKVLLLLVAVCSLVHASPSLHHDGYGGGVIGIVSVAQRGWVSANSLWHIELGYSLIFYTDADNDTSSTSSTTTTDISYHYNIDPSSIFILPRIHKDDAFMLEGTVLVHDWGYAIFIPAVNEQQATQHATMRGYKFSPIKKETILVSLLSLSDNDGNDDAKNNIFTNDDNHVALELGLPPISKLVSLIDQSQWFADVSKLASYNRYSLGSGISSARSWIEQELARLPNLTVTIQEFPLRTSLGYNIIATMKGTTLPDEWVIMGAHYDSTSQSTSTAAPGAEDNGSGSAGLLQLARALSIEQAPRTAIFIWFSGEEQGLIGSIYNAKQIVANGDKAKVKLMHNMDMIGYTQNENTLRCLLETNSQWQSLFTTYRQAAATYAPNLVLATSTNAWGSDHEPYLKEGMPALLTIDYDWDKYPHYHRTTDLPQYLNQNIAAAILRMNVATLAAALGYIQ